MAFGTREHSASVLFVLFALSIGIAAIAIGAQHWTCSAPLAAYLVDVGGIMLGFGIASYCTYFGLVMLTEPLGPGDAMGGAFLAFFCFAIILFFGVVGLGLVTTVIVLTVLNGPYAWDLSSNDASRDDYCDEKLTSGARGIVVALSVLLGLLVVSPVACICNTTSISPFDRALEKKQQLELNRERIREGAKEFGLDQEFDNPVDASSEDVGVDVGRKSFEMPPAGMA